MNQSQLMLVTVALVAACGQPAPHDTASAGPAVPADSAPSLSPEAASQIFSHLHLADDAETDAAREAAERGGSPQVRRVARQIVEDNERQHAAAHELASRYGVTLSGDADSDSISPLPRRPYSDLRFVDEQIAAHQEHIDSLRVGIMPVAGYSEVRGFLEETLAVMERHLDELRRVRSELAGSASR